MANCYTRKFKTPRTTTMLSYQAIDLSKIRPQQRLLSPTRMGVPHPDGLQNQNIPSTQGFLLWLPDFRKKMVKYPKMIQHINKVNFTCKHPETFDYEIKKREVPVIHYTENTTSRRSYQNPAKLPTLCVNETKTWSGNTPTEKAAIGIVPNMVVPEYLPVVER